MTPGPINRSATPPSPADLAAEVIVQLRDLLADERAADGLRRVLDMEDELLSLDDVCRLTGFGDTKVRELVRRRAIPMLKIGGDWRITRRAYRAAAAAGFAPPSGRVMTKRRAAA